jgi:hypothetical protein
MTTRSLYKVHCRTFKIAREIMACGLVTTDPEHAFHGFRCFPPYRTEAGKELRRKVLNVIRIERNAA